MKTSEIRGLSESDIQTQIDEHESMLSELQSAHAMQTLENPARMRKVRQTIARLKTILRERELAS
jgi:large subunit ribosomal protein L29